MIDEKQNEKTKQDNMIEGGVRKADTAIKDTAEVYLKKFGVNLDLD
jgi:hypothetical protein